jgi:gliding motility-associated lipoprotein GldH
LKKINKYFIPVLFAALCTIVACGDDRFYEKNIGVSNARWHKDDIKTFEVEIEDTTSQYDFFINIRNTGAYDYANLFVFINTHFPDGRLSRDTVELFLADPAGKWLGEGSGDVYDNRFLFKRAVMFPLAGIYKFEFEQAMRKEVLPEILDVGLRIEKRES